MIKFNSIKAKFKNANVTSGYSVQTHAIKCRVEDRQGRYAFSVYYDRNNKKPYQVFSTTLGITAVRFKKQTDAVKCVKKYIKRLVK